MPIGLDQGDRKILIAAAVAMVLLTAASALVLRPAQGRSGIPSTYAATSDGAKAAYLLLKESGYDVQRWQASPNDLPASGRGYVLVFADPSMGVARDERQRIALFLRTGGRVLATGYAGALLLPESDERFDAPPSWDWQSFAPTAPSPITNGVHEIKMWPQQRWGTRYPAHVAVVGDEAGPVVITYPYGDGQVIWWSRATPLTNAALRDANDLELFLNSIGPRPGTHVLWDEYLHGERPGMWSHLRNTPTPWALVQLGLIGAFVLVTFARRSGPIRMPAAEPRLSPLEFVDTVGALYHKAGAASAAVEIAYKRFRYLLMRQAGVAVNARPPAVVDAVRHRPGFDAQLLETLRDCELALYDSGFAQERGLDLVRRLHHYVAAMRLAPATREEVR